jgi:integrase
MVVVGWYTGLRVADVGRLDASQLDRDARLLRVVPAKTARRKPHPLSIPLVGLAWEVVSRRAEAGGPLFPGAVVWRGKQCLVRGEIFAEFAAAFGRLAQPAGWRTSFHGLRASFISQMDEAGVPASITDAITGHAPQTMHGHYSQPCVAALREAVARAIAPLKI